MGLDLEDLSAIRAVIEWMKKTNPVVVCKVDCMEKDPG